MSLIDCVRSRWPSSTSILNPSIGISKSKRSSYRRQYSPHRRRRRTNACSGQPASPSAADLLSVGRSGSSCLSAQTGGVPHGTTGREKERLPSMVRSNPLLRIGFHAALLSFLVSRHVLALSSQSELFSDWRCSQRAGSLGDEPPAFNQEMGLPTYGCGSRLLAQAIRCPDTSQDSGSRASNFLKMDGARWATLFM